MNDIEKLDPEDQLARDLLSPDWPVIEQHYGSTAPTILKNFYQDPNRVLLVNFEVTSDLLRLEDGLHVESYAEIGEDSLIGAFDDMENYLPIARGLGGEEYVVDISEDDPQVFYYQYDIGDDPEKLQFTGLRLSRFLSAERVPFEE